MGFWAKGIAKGALGTAPLPVANGGTGSATAAAARTALGTNKLYLPIRVTTLVGSNVYYTVAPVAGTISKIWSVIEGVLTTGNATLTGKINGSAITDGAITITQSGSAAGDVDSATPSAANTVVAGDNISVTVGGTNATASVAMVLVELTY